MKNLTKADKRIIKGIAKELKEDQSKVEEMFKLFFKTLKTAVIEDILSETPSDKTKFMLGRYFKFQVVSNKLLRKIDTYEKHKGTFKASEEKLKSLKHKAKWVLKDYQEI